MWTGLGAKHALIDEFLALPISGVADRSREVLTPGSIVGTTPAGQSVVEMGVPMAADVVVEDDMADAVHSWAWSLWCCGLLLQTGQ